MIDKVVLSKGAEKDLRRAPSRIASNLKTWAELVETNGLETVRAIPGYHDETLKGKRTGQRSVRLNIAWRAIYTIAKDESGKEVVRLITVVEVSKHEY